MPMNPIDLTPTVSPPRSARGLLVRVAIVLTVVGAMIGVAKAWDLGYSPSQLWETRARPLATQVVDRGDVAVYVTETGTMESASNTTIKCQVEALIGLVGGTTKGAQGSGSGGGQSSQAAPGGSQSGGASSSATARTAAATPAKKAATPKGSVSTSKTTSSSSVSTPASTSAASGSASTSTSGSNSSGGSGSSGASATSTTTITPRPTIRSFSFTVPPYVSLRPATRGSSTPTKGAGGMGGGNRGGGGGGGGGGAAGGEQEKPGSTRIIMIKTEGTEVSAGEVVCELDSSAFRDALLSQRIKHDQAKAWVLQARSILEVNEISLREYREGIYPQDLLLIRHYLSTCRKEEDRARRNLAWSQPVYQKGFRTRAQYEADVLALKRSEIALGEAERMEDRLLRYTGPKIIKSLEAKLEANRADALAQDAALQIESDRQRRLERMVANCTLRAPHEGIVVYSVPLSSGFRPAATLIQEGATVREGQSIFELPDANKMRVRAKVNESKVGQVQVGQKASIRVDAFPSKILIGTVTEVTAIPAPAAGPSSDIKVYYANVAIDSGGFDGLRPGMSAEVSLFIDAHRDATRVPIQSVRWVDRVPFAALATTPDGSTYRWQPVEIGLMNNAFAEIRSGLRNGDRVIADPEALPEPPPTAAPALRASGDVTRPRG